MKEQMTRLEAADKSVGKWEDAVREYDKFPLDREFEKYSNTAGCGLCELYNKIKKVCGEEVIDCGACPISLESGFNACAKTPFEIFDDCVDLGGSDEELLESAMSMLLYVNYIRDEIKAGRL